MNERVDDKADHALVAALRRRHPVLLDGDGNCTVARGGLVVEPLGFIQGRSRVGAGVSRRSQTGEKPAQSPVDQGRLCTLYDEDGGGAPR